MDFHLICPKCPPLLQIPLDLLDFKTHVATFHLGLVSLRKIDDDGLNNLIEVETEAIKKYAQEYAENILARYIFEQKKTEEVDLQAQKPEKIEIIDLETDLEVVDASPIEEKPTELHGDLSLPSTSENEISNTSDFVEIDDYEDHEGNSPLLLDIVSPASPDPENCEEEPQESFVDMEELIEIDEFEEEEDEEGNFPVDDVPSKNKEPKEPIRFPIKKSPSGKVVKRRDRRVRSKTSWKSSEYGRVESDHHVCQYRSCCGQSSSSCFLCLGKHPPADCGSIIEIFERKLQCSIVGRCRDCGIWHTDRRPCEPGVCNLCRRRGHNAMFCPHSEGVHQRAKLRKLVNEQKLVPTRRLQEILKKRKEQMRQEEEKLLTRTIFP